MATSVPRRVDARLVVALAAAFVLHGGLLASGSFRSTYDAYVHLFFADHYRRSWFSTWEPRWYTGFTTVSYPPGSHQLLALSSRVAPGGEAFAVVALGATLLLTVGVYRFARIWVGDRAAGYAAILLALSSSIGETLHVFGQLPTLLSLALLLNALPFAHRWVVDGGVGVLVAAVACSAATTAAHHVTTLFGSVFFLGPVLVHALLQRLRTPLPDEPQGHVVGVSRATVWPLVARRLRRVLPAAVRAGVYGALVVVGLVVVVLPYWLWSAADPITQLPIPHASRESFLAAPDAGLVFWLVPWGALLVVLPYALLRGATTAAWPLAVSVALLTLLGTGGTTPLPRMLLGGAYEILTLDRFTFWATVAVLPLAGRFVESLVHGRVRRLLVEQLGRRVAVVLTATFGTCVLVAVVVASTLTAHRPFQPAPIDMDPIVEFLAKDEHDRWRYLTLGFGDQMAWLSAQSTAESVDGNYHSARRLPELTSTPVERLEGAKYSGVPGLGSLQQFLAVPEKYHLKFVFSNDQFYDPLLSASGWQRLPALENGIAVWQREDVAPLPPGRTGRELPAWQRAMWGVLPMTAMAAASVVLLLHALGVDLGAPRARLPLPRFASSIDGRLRAASARLPEHGRSPSWTVLRRLRSRLRRFELRPIGVGRRRLQVLALIAVVLTSAVLVGARAARPATPTETVLAYHDALDLRRLDDAFGLLDPAARPSWTEFVTRRSVENGLVASYARLDRIETDEVTIEGDRAVVVSTLVYVTSLDEHVVESVDELRRVDGRWRLQPDAGDLRIPPDQLVSRVSVDHLAQGRRRVADGPTAYQDVLDRPELRILSAGLVRRDGRLSVVGELRNTDVDPGHVTVTAELVDGDGEVVGEYAAAVGAVHTALPSETVPFRIDFEGVAGLTDGPDSGGSTPVATPVPFEAGARTPLNLDPSLVAEVRVSARAVVTGSDLERTLTAQRITVDDAARSLGGVLRNDGVDEVTVPHVFVTLRDEAGAVVWVADAFSSEAVRAQRSLPFVLELPAPAEVERFDVPVVLFADARADADADAGARPATPPLLVDAAGWPGVDVMVVGFTRPSS